MNDEYYAKVELKGVFIPLTEREAKGSAFQATLQLRVDTYDLDLSRLKGLKGEALRGLKGELVIVKGTLILAESRTDLPHLPEVHYIHPLVRVSMIARPIGPPPDSP